VTALGGNMRGFKSHADVEVTFYANGLSIAGFPFHDYQTRQAKNILGDILDGYFPYDLKTKYPEGVPLKMVDRTQQLYLGEVLQKKSFAEDRKGVEIGGSAKSPMLRNKQSLSPHGRDPHQKNWKEPTDNGVTSSATAKREDTITPKTHASDLQASEIVKLRVRADTHNQKVKNIMLHLLPSDNLATVYKYVKQYI
jgi:hypothetical protein